MSALPFEAIDALTAGRLGVHDVPCPLCSSQVSPRGARRKVLRIWCESDDFAGFACARCDAKGWARDRGASSPVSLERLRTIRREAQERSKSERAQSLQKARFLWSRRRPVEPGTPPWTYLRERRRYQGPVPATLGYLPPGKPEHHAALIAAFGLAQEPEPGRLAIEDADVRGVHLTLLRPDGSDKANVESAKLIVGQGSEGTPIILAPPNDLLGLAVCEGIENGLSLHESTGLGVWTAGCANRLPALADAVPAWINFVAIAADADQAGLQNAEELRTRLRKRGIHCETKPLASLGRAA